MEGAAALEGGREKEERRQWWREGEERGVSGFREGGVTGPCESKLKLPPMASKVGRVKGKRGRGTVLRGRVIQRMIGQGVGVG